MTDRSDLKKRVRARMARTGESYTAARAHVLRARADAEPRPSAGPEQITAAVLKCNRVSLRVSVPGEPESLTLRCSSYDAWRVAPGQLVEARIDKRWTWRDDPYAAGAIARVWTDVPALGLEPLPLVDEGLEVLAESCEPFESPDPYAEMWAFLASTPRRVYEFDGVAWGEQLGDPDDPYGSPISDAVEMAAHDRDAARELLMEILAQDLRCIDAHAHLGNLRFDQSPREALVHYEIGVGIGELSLGPRFDGMLPRGLLYNRSFLRALHGQGLCLWRLGDLDGARAVFERMLSLDPPDGAGARFCWHDVRRGRPWSPDERAGLEGEALH